MLDSQSIRLVELEELRYRLIGAYRSRSPEPPAGTSSYGANTTWCVIWLIESGHVTLQTARGVERIEAGNWILRMPGMSLDHIFSSDAGIISIRFQLLWPRGRSLFYGEHYQVIPRDEEPALLQACIDYIDYLPGNVGRYFEQTKLTAEMSVDEYFKAELCRVRLLSIWYEVVTQRLGYQVQPVSSSDDRVNVALAILYRHRQRCNVPYERLQQHLGLSRSHIDRLFQQHLGRSPKDEHSFLRMNHARDRLTGTTLPIKRIAGELGFNDASQFARWFRGFSGRNPAEYRNAGVLQA